MSDYLSVCPADWLAVSLPDILAAGSSTVNRVYGNIRGLTWNWVNFLSTALPPLCVGFFTSSQCRDPDSDSEQSVGILSAVEPKFKPNLMIVYTKINQPRYVRLRLTACTPVYCLLSMCHSLKSEMEVERKLSKNIKKRWKSVHIISKRLLN